MLSGLPFGPGNGNPLFIESLVCQGNEERLLSCADIDLRLSSCTHQDDVSVRCNGV